MKKLTATESAIQKLSPANVRLSGKMRFLVDSALGIDNGARGPRGETPSPLSITSDGFLLAGMGNMFIGTADDFARNLDGLFATVKLTKKERAAFSAVYAQHVTDWRRL